MLAIPISTKDSTTISDLYGNTPFFALLDEEEGNFRVIENEEKGNGGAIGNFLAQKGVTSTIFYHMGEGVYQGCVAHNITVYKSTSKIDTIDSIYFQALEKKFVKLDTTNNKDLLDSGSTSCKCDCEG